METVAPDDSDSEDKTFMDTKAEEDFIGDVDETEYDSGDEEVVKEQATTSGKRDPNKVVKENETEEALTKIFSNMSVSTTEFDMTFKCPYIMYQYSDNG